jgi:GxxExxY protein
MDADVRGWARMGTRCQSYERGKRVTTRPTPMDREEERLMLNALAEQVIGCAYEVSNALGANFAERVYENALALELREAGLRAAQQYGMTAFYKGQSVGDFAVDLLVEERLMVELKAVPLLEEAHRAQCLNYLRASGLKLCLLINFGTSRVQVKRIVLDF